MAKTNGKAEAFRTLAIALRALREFCDETLAGFENNRPLDVARLDWQVDTVRLVAGLAMLDGRPLSDAQKVQLSQLLGETK